MPILLLVGVSCSVLFYRAADAERLSPLLWGAASLALTLAAAVGGRGVIVILAGQAGLFLVMWWYNAYRRRAK
jgi:hypothetical protein